MVVVHERHIVPERELFNVGALGLTDPQGDPGRRNHVLDSCGKIRMARLRLRARVAAMEVRRKLLEEAAVLYGLGFPNSSMNEAWRSSTTSHPCRARSPPHCTGAEIC